MYNLKTLIKDKTCLKNPNKPSYIDLLQTDQKVFKIQWLLKQGCNFYKMCNTVIKKYYSKQKPIIHYCNFKDFDNGAL